jgi:2-polyprenyl-6-methoxyphenol hydroxylase-like FAD-dependent oxidoreductase
MTGKELARIYSWGNDPWRKGEYELSSPCRHADLPQTKLEPMLIREASLKGVVCSLTIKLIQKCRFNTQFESYEKKDDHVLTTVLDRLTNKKYIIKSKYLFGADGANSRIAKQLGIPHTFKSNIRPSILRNTRAILGFERHGRRRLVRTRNPPDWKSPLDNAT